MSGFTPQALEKKLGELNQSQQSIQTLSLWLIHHRKHFKAIVQTWFKELKKAKPTRRLTFMYLANDVIQNSKKKGPEYSKEFLTVLKSSFLHICTDVDSKTLSSLDRLVKIWEERGIYDKAAIKGFRQALHPNENSDGSKENTTDNKDSKNDNSANISSSNNKKHKTKRENDEDSKNNGRSSKKLAINSQFDSTVLNNLISKIGSGSFEMPPIDPAKFEKVEPDQMIKALKDLENCASADAAIRQQIANYPSEVFDAKLMEGVLNQESSDRWAKVVQDAESVLTSYNSRLEQEMEDRRRLQTLMVCFAEVNRRALTEAEQSLNEYRDKLRKVNSAKDEYKRHMKNLPDIENIQLITPLPSAPDLFKL